MHTCTSQTERQTGTEKEEERERQTEGEKEREGSGARGGREGEHQRYREIDRDREIWEVDTCINFNLDFGGYLDITKATLGEILQALPSSYCDTTVIILQ